MPAGALDVPSSGWNYRQDITSPDCITKKSPKITSEFKARSVYVVKLNSVQIHLGPVWRPSRRPKTGKASQCKPVVYQSANVHGRRYGCITVAWRSGLYVLNIKNRSALLWQDDLITILPALKAFPWKSGTRTPYKYSVQVDEVDTVVDHDPWKLVSR